jgi:uncharacterized repeat protein (TIGR04138 family)
MSTIHSNSESDLHRKDLPYPEGAYDFVREGLGYTQMRMVAEAQHGADEPRHIKGQELCLGLRDFAIERWGLLAPVVLRHFRIQRTEDFGRIVFALVSEGDLSKTAEDSLADFRGVFDLTEAFSEAALLAGIAER